MKPLRLMFSLVAIFAGLGIASTASALTSEALVMIDGSGDGFVDIVAFNTDPDQDFNFGFYDGGFNQILAATDIMDYATFNDGDIVDFAIQAVSGSTVYRLSDGNAIIGFNGDSTSLSIIWTVGNINVVTRLSAGDSFALASSVSPMPEPSAALVFGAGLLIAGSRVRRQSQA